MPEYYSCRHELPIARVDKMRARDTGHALLCVRSTKYGELESQLSTDQYRESLLSFGWVKLAGGFGFTAFGRYSGLHYSSL